MAQEQLKKHLGEDGFKQLISLIKTGFANLSHKHTVADITDYTVDNSLNSNSTNPVQNKVVKSALDGKVPTTRTVNGKPLDANITLNASDVGAATPTDVTNAKNAVQGNLTQHIDNGDIHFSSAERTKLSGIASGAEVNVQADWNETNTSSDAYIKNKPSGAGTNLGLVKSGGDVTIKDGVITVNDDSHNHVIGNIDNLQSTLDGKVPTSRTINGKALTGNITLSSSDVGADKSGTASGLVDVHNANTSAHNDIRLLINALSTKLDNFLDLGTDEEVGKNVTDSISEIISLIEGNSDLIESITTSKVNVSDIVNNLTTNVTNKPLSAAQGVAIKALIDALQTAVNGKSNSGHTHDDRYYTESEINTKLDDKANKSHGNHVPTTQTANNKVFLRNDNTWQEVTPDNIGAAKASHGTHVSYSTTAPVMDGTASVGSEGTVARSDHKHPTDTSRASKSEFDQLASNVIYFENAGTVTVNI